MIIFLPLEFLSIQTFIVGRDVSQFVFCYLENLETLLFLSFLAVFIKYGINFGGIKKNLAKDPKH